MAFAIQITVIGLINNRVFWMPIVHPLARDTGNKFMWAQWNNRRPSIAFLVLVICLGMLSTVVAQTKAPAEIYTVTGVDFVNEIELLGFSIELTQVVDKKSPEYKSNGTNLNICEFTGNAELVLDTTRIDGSAASCRLSIFRKSDKLTPGWTIERMQWRGDLRQVNFVVDPEVTGHPQIVIELVYRKNEKITMSKKRIRLLLVRLSGPKGRSWKDAFQ